MHNTEDRWFLVWSSVAFSIWRAMVLKDSFWANAWVATCSAWGEILFEWGRLDKSRGVVRQIEEVLWDHSVV